MTTKPPAPPDGPLTREQATEIARAAILGLKSGFEFVLLEDRTEEADWGFAFHYTSQKFLETGDPRFIVPGTGPFVVERSTGEVTFLSTAMPPARAIAEYVKRRAPERA